MRRKRGGIEDMKREITEPVMGDGILARDQANIEILLCKSMRSHIDLISFFFFLFRQGILASNRLRDQPGRQAAFGISPNRSRLLSWSIQLGKEDMS